MTDRNQDPLPPETHNSEQDDEDSQAQSVSEEAQRRSTAVGLGDTEKAKGGVADTDEQDLVDHMRQMDTSGTIDMSAFEGERNDDDEDGMYANSARDE